MKRGADDTLAVIIGRADSKGLPGKNSMPLAGRPMICHTIDDALQAAFVDRAIVSTDGPAIAQAAESMGVEVVRRPEALASDTATVDAAVRHAVEAMHSNASVIVILYANVPLRPDDLIDRAVQTLSDARADSVQSYSEVAKNHPYWMVRLDSDHRVEPFMPNTAYRRQDLPTLYIPDGGVIAVRRESLFTIVPGQPHAFLGRDRRGIISPPGLVVDVDTLADFRLAESIFEGQILPDRVPA